MEDIESAVPGADESSSHPATGAGSCPASNSSGVSHLPVVADPRVGSPLSIDVTLEAAEQQRLDAIEHSARELLDRILDPDENAVWNLREVVWPALCLAEFREIDLERVSLRLLPLSRIGQMEGKSGSLVLIGSFSAPELGDLHSHPLIIKTRDVRKPDPDRLDQEYSNAKIIKPFAYTDKDSFSIPIFFDPTPPGFKVLWSICSLPGPLWSGEPGSTESSELIRVDDLREPLQDDDHEQVKSTLDEVFALLQPCHRRFSRPLREARAVGDEYEWYLRGFESEAEDGPSWGARWREVWGDATERLVERPDGTFVNPLWVLDRVRSSVYTFSIGAIHGDLHPGNVVYNRGGRPVLIDFGWAQGAAHIAKDFVLMECNLRFLMLRPQLRDQELDRFSGWVGWTAPIPNEMCEYLKQRAMLVQLVRDKARSSFAAETDWTQEYLVPLFLVAFGLLRFAPQLGNQRAAIRFIEALAAHLADVIGL